MTGGEDPLTDFSAFTAVGRWLSVAHHLDELTTALVFPALLSFSRKSIGGQLRPCCRTA